MGVGPAPLSSVAATFDFQPVQHMKLIVTSSSSLMSIFDKRSQQEALSPAAPPANPKEPMKKETTTLSSIPSKTLGPNVTRGPDIGKGVKIDGQIYSKEDLYVDGEVEGTIELEEHCLTIGSNAKVHANIKAREVVVLGSIHGNVEVSDKLEVRKDGSVVGDIKAARIAVDDGAYFKGRIDTVKPEPTRYSPSWQPQVTPVAAAALVN